MLSPSTRSVAKSQAAFETAQTLMPGGVSSPVRAFKAVGGTPMFIREAEGHSLTDLDGNTYIDYVGSYGPIILGHSDENVVAALSKAVGRGTSYGAPTEAEIELASIITSALPAVEMLRFVNSGTEAAMSAVRLARAVTGREKVIKCAGCYHGHVDALLVDAGSGALTLGTPSSPGVPSWVAANTLTAQFNDLDSARHLFEQFPNDVACFAVEPVCGNMGVVLPKPGYLAGLRSLCDEFGALLLFDEVMTGFRVAWGGAQVRYTVRPDITCLGKVIGGGLPVGAYGGSRELMQRVSPAGPVYQAGTLSGNPLAMAAGIATLERLKDPRSYLRLEEISAQLAEGFAKAADRHGVPVTINRVGSMLTIFFTRNFNQPVDHYADATACDIQRFKVFFHAMLERGIYLPPSQFEAFFVSLAHDEDCVLQTLAAADDAFLLLTSNRSVRSSPRES